jgi:PEP-CTERM motif
MRPGYLLLAYAGVALGVTLTAAGATTLTMENVINRVPGSGEAGPNDPFATFGLCQPSAINPGDGLPFLTACAPGEIGRYPAGVPRDEPLVNDVRPYNNTPYNITSVTLQIVGSAVEPVPFDFTITLDPNVSAFFGDANGDGKTGLSDMFSTITLSADHRTITYSDGLIPVGGRFTDFLFSMTDNGEPFKAGVYTSFDGFLAVPEPATWTLLLTGLAAAGILRRRTLRPQS